MDGNVRGNKAPFFHGSVGALSAEGEPEGQKKVLVIEVCRSGGR